MLSCDAERQFWVSFSESALGVGRGETVGDDTLLHFTDTTLTLVHAISLRSPLPGNAARWRYRKHDGKRRMHSADSLQDYFRNEIFFIQIYFKCFFFF